MQVQAYFWLLLIAGVSLEIVGDVGLKYWALTHKNPLLIAGVVMYILSTITWAVLLRYEGLARAVSLFT